VPQAFDRLSNGLVGQPSRGQFLLEGDIGQQVQGPSASSLAEPARGLVENALERVRLGLVKYGPGVLGPALLLPQTRGPFPLEGVDRVADGSDGTPDPCGDPRRPLALGATQEDLGTPQGERLAATKARLEFLTLRIGEPSNE
jgi:hypothetical protein